MRDRLESLVMGAIAIGVMVVPVLAFMFYLAFIGGVIWTVFHFVSKLW